MNRCYSLKYSLSQIGKTSHATFSPAFQVDYSAKARNRGYHRDPQDAGGFNMVAIVSPLPVLKEMKTPTPTGSLTPTPGAECGSRDSSSPLLTFACETGPKKRPTNLAGVTSKTVATTSFYGQGQGQSREDEDPSMYHQVRTSL